MFIGFDANTRKAGNSERGRVYVLWPHQEGGPTFLDIVNKHECDQVFPWNPTHWMELPALPEA